MRHYLFKSLLILVFSTLPYHSFAKEALSAYQAEAESLEGVEEVKDLTPLVYSGVDLEHLQSKGYSHSREEKVHSYSKNRKGDNTTRNSWKPQFEPGNQIQSPSAIFFRADIGLGLLYFNNVRGNLAGVPTDLHTSQNGNAPYRSRLMYNRTPAYEYILGYRFMSYFKFGVAYLHQANISVQTKYIDALSPPSRPASVNFNQLSSNLSLDAVLLKLYVESPWPLFWRSVMTNGYLGTGIGLGWQTWTSNKVNRVTVDADYWSKPQQVRQKVSTNAVWVVDVGARMQKASTESLFSVLAGCKFNIWGQARNLGKLSQQGGYKYGLLDPFTIKTVYQWVPYLGVQWNFPTDVKSTSKWRLEDKLNPMSTQMNVGVGLLYFKNARGNLIPRPNQNGTAGTGWQTARLNTDKLSYNRTPLFEYLVQHQFNQFVQLGVSYQNQSGITVQTPVINTQASDTFVGDYATLSSNLSLDAIMLKGYLKMPVLGRDCRVNLLPYFGFGFGPGWQTWTNTADQLIGVDTTSTRGHLGGYLPLRQKISANFVFNLDFGGQITHRNNNSFLSVVAGCKYNFWGQARNIGKLSNQSSLPIGLNSPFIIKNIYQWAPYLGVQWNFPNHYYSKKPYFLNGRSPKTWNAYLIPIELIQKNKSLISQFNVGIGFLYFSGVKGNLMIEPAISNFNVATNAPMKGKLSYNRTPLYEYQLGYRFCSLFKMSLAYQHQGNVVVQSEFVTGGAGTATFDSQKMAFTSNLNLDGFFLKAYLELPKGIVWGNLVTSPYLAVGAGPAWQTWKRTTIVQTFTSGGTFNEQEVPLRQKASANVGFMWDAGLRMQSPYPNSGFSTTLGLKFNLWGQAREMGKLSQQLTPRYGLGHPVKVKTLYQWSPYVGVQWNF